jgi:hypothetical protein
MTAISAQADPVTITGSSQGGFDGSAVSTTASLTGTFFRIPVTAMDFAGQGFSTSVPGDGSPSTVSIASFDLRTFSNFNFKSHTFDLLVTFTAPAGVGGNPATFTANMTGVITANELLDGNEFVTIDFDNTPQVFSFAGGSFTFAVQDLNVYEQSGFVPLTAQLTVETTPTPEPMSMALMGTGLAGVAMALRKRKQKQPDSRN